MTELPINQKEYLKKYLAIGKAPGEKKKRKKKHISTRVQIIDDDAVTIVTNNTIENDPIVIDEDAPQIVAIIDERPPSLRFDEKTKNPLWRPIGPVENTNPGEQKQVIKGFKIEPKINDKSLLRPDKSPPRRKRKSDHSPPPKSRREKSPVRDIVVKEERQSVPRSVENSPKSVDEENEILSPRRSRTGDNNSPPRRIKREDSSPPRRFRGDDHSPPRRSRTTDDNSPPRRNRTNDNNSAPGRNWANDNSPPRRSRMDDDNSPPRRGRKSSIDRNKSQPQDDISPPRKRRPEGDSSISRRRHDDSPRRIKKDDFSSPRRRRRDNSSPRGSRPSETPPRKKDDRKSVKNRTPDHSPPRKSKKEDKSRVAGSSRNDEKRPKKMEKTLDNKTAGLQNARELIEETRNHHLREDKFFKSLSKDVSGESATTVHRDRQTGKIRNLEEEEERQRKKREEEEKNKEKYEKWGRGLAQVESREQQLKEQLHEMSKPLARYADDEDLERFLKEQEREGDPMLAYIRKKKRKKAADAGEVTKPLFEGEFMPNRYGIRPGHRWDGVDRSNGYEKKWFEVQNQKKAQEEDVYKWSTEDM